MKEEASIDQLFLDKVLETIEDNLANENFGVEELALEIGLSRSQLLRKLIALTGQPPSQLIKEFRLKRAMEMLQNKLATASEISYQVGFGSPSYFNTCFNEYFGYPPGKVKHSGSSGIKKKHSISRKYFIIALAPLVVIALVFVSYSIVSKRNTETGKARILDPSIAVLPFQNFSADTDQEFMCLGLTDEIINQLCKLESFDKVISMTTVLNYRNPDRNIPSIGNELGVNYILEGSYKKIGEELKVSAQLIEASSDRHIWIQDFSRPYVQIMTVQSDIALQIARQLNAYVSDEEQRQIEKIPTTSKEAYELYQMGRFFLDKRTTDGSAKAKDYFEQAIKIDPGYALAYAGLASTYRLMAWTVDSMDRQENRDRAEKLALKALKLDGNLSEAYAVLGIIYKVIDWEMERAEETIQHALVLNPNNAIAHLWYASSLDALGRHEEARMHLNKAVELDPLSYVIRIYVARSYLYQGQFEEGLQELKKVYEIHGDHARIDRFMLYAYYQLGKEDEAFEALKKRMAGNSLFDLETAEQIYQDSGLNAVIQWKVDIEINVVEEHPKYNNIARQLALLGKDEEALYWLEKSYQAHKIGDINTDFWFKNLHDQPRFQAILKGMGVRE
jgi:TolB-like protein/AraC-like DNA-binding protein